MSTILQVLNGCSKIEFVKSFSYNCTSKLFFGYFFIFLLHYLEVSRHPNWIVYLFSKPTTLQDLCTCRVLFFRSQEYAVQLPYLSWPVYRFKWPKPASVYTPNRPGKPLLLSIHLANQVNHYYYIMKDRQTHSKYTKLNYHLII